MALLAQGPCLGAAGMLAELQGGRSSVLRNIPRFGL